LQLPLPIDFMNWTTWSFSQYYTPVLNTISTVLPQSMHVILL